MQDCLHRSQLPEASEVFWVLYWHRLWQSNNTPIAMGHLSAYLQESCYWAAQKLTINLSRGESVVDFFQIAITRIDRVLKGFNPQQGNTLKQYASLSFSNVIKDTLRMRREVEICTDWALLHKVSQRRLTEALQNLGLSPSVVTEHVLAWQCFQALYAPQSSQAARKLAKPQAETLAAIATFYNQERLTQLGSDATATTSAQIEQWLLTCGQAIRSYLYPAMLSADAKLSPEGDAFLDNFESTFQASTLSSVIEAEEALLRQDYQLQLNAILLRALVKLDLAAQRLLQAYYGQGLTQQDLAKQMGVKQYTISRRLTSLRNSLLQVLADWSQNTLHQSLDSDVLSSMSNVLEEWLKVHYSHPDLPS
jgi:RNA polymerase sigma factor (sigma-70 family)